MLENIFLLAGLLIASVVNFVSCAGDVRKVILPDECSYIYVINAAILEEKLVLPSTVSHFDHDLHQQQKKLFLRELNLQQ